jgi:hypothetical protein
MKPTESSDGHGSIRIMQLVRKAIQPERHAASAIRARDLLESFADQTQAGVQPANAGDSHE